MHKSYPAQIKAAGTADGLLDGQFKALVSVFGNKDSYGDVIVPGAFTKTLADWQEKGQNIPVYWSHQLADPDMNLGWVEDAAETEAGLEVLVQLDLGEGGPAKAKTVHRLLKRDRAKMDFSFSYDVVDGSTETDDAGDEFNELRELKLYEVGPTPIGANPATELLAVKHLDAATLEAGKRFAAAVKAGRVLSSKNETTLRESLTALEACATQIKSVLAALEPSDGKAIPNDSTRAVGAPAKDDEPHVAKSDEPRRRPSVDRWDTELLLTEMEAQS